MAYLIDFDLVALPVIDANWNTYLARGGTVLVAFDHMQKDLSDRQRNINGPWKDVFSSEASPIGAGGQAAFDRGKVKVQNAASNVLVGQPVTIAVPAGVSWIPVGDRHLIHSAMIAGGQAVTLPCKAQVNGLTLSYEVAVRAVLRDLER